MSSTALPHAYMVMRPRTAMPLVRLSTLSTATRRSRRNGRNIGSTIDMSMMRLFLNQAFLLRASEMETT